GGQARGFPAGHVAVPYEPQQFALTGHNIAEIQPCEFVLPRTGLHQHIQRGQALPDPDVERTLVFEFARADAVRNALQRVFHRMRPGVHGVDAPLIARAVVCGVPDPVQHRVAHVDVGRAHVDTSAQAQAAVRVFAVAHFAQQAQRFVGRAVSPGRIGARFGEGAAVGSDLVGGLFVDISMASLHQRFCELVHPREVVAGEVQVGFVLVLPIEAQPLHHVDDGVYVFGFFLLRVGVVEAQVAGAVVIARQPEIQADALGVADVQVAVGFRRKARTYAGRIRARPALDRSRNGAAVGGVADVEVAGGFRRKARTYAGRIRARPALDRSRTGAAGPGLLRMAAFRQVFFDDGAQKVGDSAWAGYRTHTGKG